MDKSVERALFLIEYSLKTQKNDMGTETLNPTFDEYKKMRTDEADEEENNEEPVELDADGLPASLPPEQGAEDQQPEEFQSDDMGGSEDSTDAVKAAFSGKEPQDDAMGGDGMSDNIEYQQHDDKTEEYFNELESRMDTIDQQLEKITSFLPKPESAEDKIIKKIEQLDDKINQIANKDDDKWKDIGTQNPFNITLKDYYSSVYNDEPKEKEKFVITKDDVENYDPIKIKNSLGIN